MKVDSGRSERKVSSNTGAGNYSQTKEKSGWFWGGGESTRLKTKSNFVRISLAAEKGADRLL